jgi:surfeit locus 1 family protein
MIIFNRRFKPSWAMTMLTFAGICLFVSLGLWQLERAALKNALKTKYEARLDAEFRQIEASEYLSEHDISDMEFQKLIIHGHYDLSRTILIDNQLREGRAGYHVVTPFIMNGGDKIVLVNRGWVGIGNSREQLPRIEAPVTEATVRGIVSFPDSDGFRMGQVSLKDKWPQVIPFIEIEAMQLQFQNRLLPIIIWLDPEQPGHYPRDWNPVYDNPEKSRAYAWQWFAFAVISLGLFVGLNLRSKDNG